MSNPPVRSAGDPDVRAEALKTALAVLGPDAGIDHLVAVAEYIVTGRADAAMAITEQTARLYRGGEAQL
ncbi:hypothetical protein [Pseudonocardia alni]|uniref:hypothetical protein n=1 Tax=Pseudonocardia alni TaxID=33907 RepID=UPI003319C87F